MNRLIIKRTKSATMYKYWTIHRCIILVFLFGGLYPLFFYINIYTHVEDFLFSSFNLQVFHFVLNESFLCLIKLLFSKSHYIWRFSVFSLLCFNSLNKFIWTKPLIGLLINFILPKKNQFFLCNMTILLNNTYSTSNLC
jgi:hypothetical protein